MVKGGVAGKPRVGRREKIANDFLLQFAYDIAASILLILIYNGRLFKYGGEVGLAMPALLWVGFGLCAALGIVFVFLWKKQDRNGFKIAAIYLFITAAGFFWCDGVRIIAYQLKQLMPLSILSPFSNAEKLIKMLFWILAAGVVGQIAAYVYRMNNVNRAVKNTKKEKQ